MKKPNCQRWSKGEELIEEATSSEDPDDYRLLLCLCNKNSVTKSFGVANSGLWNVEMQFLQHLENKTAQTIFKMARVYASQFPGSTCLLMISKPALVYVQHFPRRRPFSGGGEATKNCPKTGMQSQKKKTLSKKTPRPIELGTPAETVTVSLFSHRNR